MTTVNYGIANTDDDVADYIPSSGLGVVASEVLNGATYAGGGVYSEAVRAGFRFLGVAPAGTDVINSATLTLTRRFSPDGTHQGYLHVVLIGNAPPWSTTSPRSAVRSVARVQLVDGAVQNYDVTALLQEIMPLRSPGDALAFVGSAEDADGSASWVDYSISSSQAAQLSITYSAGGPDVTAPAITSSDTLSLMEGNALSHSLTASEGVTWTKISGADFTLTGSTLSLAAQTYPSGPFVAVVRATDSAGNWSEQTITVSITEAPLVSYVGSASGTTTPVLPSHQAGDFIICFMFRDGSTTAPALPSGWIQAATGTSTTCSYRLVYKIATSSSESVGSASTATSCVTSVYRPKSGYTISLGATSQGNGSSTSITYQSLTMQAPNNLLGAFAGHRSVNTTLENPPSGMVLRHNVVDTTDEASAFDTGSPVSSWAAKTVSVGGTSSGWITTVYEIKVAPTASGRRRSVWISLID